MKKYLISTLVFISTFLPVLAHASSYSTNFDALTPPALPSDTVLYTGAFSSTNDGADNYISSATTSVTSTLFFNHEMGSTTTTFNFTAEFATTSNPTLSYIYPGFENQSNGLEYEVVLSRGTGEARGALWLQISSSTASIALGSPTYIGTSGTTFTANIKYTVSVAISGTSAPVNSQVGTATRTLVVSVQRASDSDWLTSGGTWSGTPQTALTVSTSLVPPSLFGYITANTYSTASNDGHIYSLGFDNEQIYRFVRATSSPVLTKGGTYNGWKADALADPQVTWDGTRYVMQVSMWSIANNEWATGFFTSPNMQTWTYVANSLFPPTGSDYILGNGGIVWFNNKYWFTYSHYPQSGGTPSISLSTSTDLLSWTSIADPLIPATAFDSSIDVNPTNNKLEIWYSTGSSVRTVHMWDSSNGTSWTDEGDFSLNSPYGLTLDYGEPAVFYIGSTRYISVDGSAQMGYRNMIFFYSPNQDTNWTPLGMSLSPTKANSWESGEVFDNDVIVTDTGDGLGNIPRDLYAGSDTFSTADNTDSSIGVVTLSAWPSGNVSTSTIEAVIGKFLFKGKFFIK